MLDIWLLIMNIFQPPALRTVPHNYVGLFHIEIEKNEANGNYRLNWINYIEVFVLFFE